MLRSPRRIFAVLALVLGVIAVDQATTTASAEAHQEVTLAPGQSASSPDGRHQLVHQHDGNVVLYGPNGAVWHTKTYGYDTSHLVFQHDGNLVLYSGSRAIWHTATHGKGEALAIQNDANLVIYNSSAPVWAIRGMEPPRPRYWSDGTPDGNRHLGAQIARDRKGWTGGQWDCLNALWTKESGWNHRISNQQGSGAYGIPQALPGSKMGSHGSDWRTNPATQIAWGLDYIAGRYGTPCGAWSHSKAHNWY